MLDVLRTAAAKLPVQTPDTEKPTLCLHTSRKRPDQPLTCSSGATKPPKNNSAQRQTDLSRSFVAWVTPDSCYGWDILPTAAPATRKFTGADVQSPTSHRISLMLSGCRWAEGRSHSSTRELLRSFPPNPAHKSCRLALSLLASHCRLHLRQDRHAQLTHKSCRLAFSLIAGQCRPKLRQDRHAQEDSLTGLLIRVHTAE